MCLNASVHFSIYICIYVQVFVYVFMHKCISQCVCSVCVCVVDSAHAFTILPVHERARETCSAAREREREFIKERRRLGARDTGYKIFTTISQRPTSWPASSVRILHLNKSSPTLAPRLLLDAGMWAPISSGHLRSSMTHLVRF